jgi:uracil-DNA glycosylase
MSQINNDWLEPLKPEFSKEYYKDLFYTLKNEYSNYIIYPDSNDIFNAFHLTPLSKVKVVIIGQDPYHEPGQAHGLSFSVKPGIDIPPSLANIYKELHDEMGTYIPNNGYLEKWAKEGVLLLNTILTVRAHSAMSHCKIGWQEFTDAAIRAVNEQDRPIVYLLWGKPAREKAKMLNNPKHLVLETVHPSPLSAYRGFFGCGHFKKANEFLIENGETPIDWQIENI